MVLRGFGCSQPSAPWGLSFERGWGQHLARLLLGAISTAWPGLVSLGSIPHPLATEPALNTLAPKQDSSTGEGWGFLSGQPVSRSSSPQAQFT